MTAAEPAFARREAGRVVLRRFRPDDLDAFVAYRRDPHVARFQSWEPDTVTVESARRFIAEVEAADPATPGAWFQIAVALAETDELVGDCALRLDDDAHQAEIGYSFAVAHQGQGLATEAVAALLAYCFDELRLHRVHATTDVRNARSTRLLERLGFRREAHCVESAWWKGEWTSEYGYALLRREWQARA